MQFLGVLVFIAYWCMFLSLFFNGVYMVLELGVCLEGLCMMLLSMDGIIMFTYLVEHVLHEEEPEVILQRWLQELYYSHYIVFVPLIMIILYVNALPYPQKVKILDETLIIVGIFSVVSLMYKW